MLQHTKNDKSPVKGFTLLLDVAKFRNPSQPRRLRKTEGSDKLRVSSVEWTTAFAFPRHSFLVTRHSVRPACAARSGFRRPWAVGACAHVDAAARGWRVRLWFSFAREIRTGVSACAWMVDRCVS